MKSIRPDEITLLQEMYSVAMDREQNMQDRQGAAKIVMPYLYRKMPTSTEVEVKGNDGIIAALKEIYGVAAPTTPATIEGGQDSPQKGE